MLAADPTLTEEAVSAMSETELLNALKAARIETAELLTEELRQAYLAAKEYEFTFAQKEATAEIIDGMDAAYQSIKSSYSELLEGYRKAIAAAPARAAERREEPRRADGGGNGERRGDDRACREGSGL